jgi:hypothetical protein
VRRHKLTFHFCPWPSMKGSTPLFGNQRSDPGSGAVSSLWLEVSEGYCPLVYLSKDDIRGCSRSVHRFLSFYLSHKGKFHWHDRHRSSVLHATGPLMAGGIPAMDHGVICIAAGTTSAI